MYLSQYEKYLLNYKITKYLVFLKILKMTTKNKCPYLLRVFLESLQKTYNFFVLNLKMSLLSQRIFSDNYKKKKKK